jgi:hypothetical protein
MKKTVLLPVVAVVLLVGVFVGRQADATLSVPLWGTVWDDLRFPANQLALIGARVPDWVKYQDDGAASRGVYALQFGDEAVNEEEVGLDAQMPHSWREGTAVQLHIHMSPEDATTCNYRVCFEYTIASTDTNFPATSETCTTFASDEVALKYQYEEIISSISMTGETISSMIKGRFYRNSSDALDTCDGKIMWLHELDIHYQRDRPGSRSQETK